MNATEFSPATQTPLRAVLWDMDGTLLDSSRYHWESWREALAAENYQLTKESFTSFFGQRNDTIMRALFGEDYPAGEIKRVSDFKESRYRNLLREGGVELLPGVGRWLRRLQSENWRQAIASSAPLLNIEAILDVLGIRDCFAAVVTAEDVERGKPDPQVFLRAAAKVNVPPARCVVVEDAPAGVEAGRRGGMRTIGVLSEHPTLQADIVVRTLEELPDSAFDDLLAGDAPSF
ncbi:MAG TPA: HAD family phosphatase [Pyrinomonadaceae bacterium]|nr:HAD family phosphatase [Pyrinomonadaceae bacterium]